MAVVDTGKPDLDWRRMEYVVQGSLPASVVADHIDHTPSELAAQALHKDAEQHDDLAEIPGASSLVHLGLGLGSLSAAVMQHVEDMPAQDSRNTSACAGTAAEADPCMDHSTADEPSLGLPSAEFEHA